MNDQDQLASHAKHIPKLLREQILCGLMSKYVVSGKTSENTEFDNEKESKWGLAGSSIQRFHGSLLFVDISGFTALSLKLDVETLKNHINEYFTKMLDIVDKWDGDVVKFAGDALYIVWPTYVSGEGNSNVADHSSLRSSASISNNAQFATSAKKGLEKAVACALEINSACGHYEIRFADNSSENTNTGILSKLLPSFTLNSLMGGSKVSPSSDDVAYLNVHAGVSCGLMAGVDLIANNRAEFFLVGNPLIGVAMAESSASKGDVVLCPAAHELLLHGDNVSLANKGHLKSLKNRRGRGRSLHSQ